MHETYKNLVINSHRCSQSVRSWVSRQEVSEMFWFLSISCRIFIPCSDTRPCRLLAGLFYLLFRYLVESYLDRELSPIICFPIPSNFILFVFFLSVTSCFIYFFKCKLYLIPHCISHITLYFWFLSYFSSLSHIIP